MEDLYFKDSIFFSKKYAKIERFGGEAYKCWSKFGIPKKRTTGHTKIGNDLFLNLSDPWQPGSEVKKADNWLIQTSLIQNVAKIEG